MVWTWGYVAGVVILCGLHVACSALGLDWRGEEILLGAFGFTSALATQLLVTESPRFLLANGDALGAIESARTMARWNGVDIDAALAEDDTMVALREAADACRLEGDGSTSDQQTGDSCNALEEDELDWTDLFTRENLPLTLTFGVMEISYNFAFYVIIFSAGSFSDQVLLNLVLLAAADLPGSTVAGTACDKIGAKRTALSFLAAASATLMSFAAFEGWAQGAGSEASASFPLELVPSALSVLGKSLCSGAFTAIFVLFSECYPVKLRSAALGSGMCFGKLGASAAAPFAAGFPLAVTLGISGGALLAASAGASTLPESQPLPPSLDEEA